MRAFHTALQIGTDVLEMDLRMTRDLKLLVFHDSTLNRTTNRQGDIVIKHMTVDDLRGDKYLDPAYHFGEEMGHPLRDKYQDAKERISIPLFEEVLAELWGPPQQSLHALPIYHNISINVEIKDNELYAADLLLATLVKWDLRHVRNHLVVSSRWCTVIEHFRKISGPYNFPTGACEGESTKLFIVATAWKFLQNWFLPAQGVMHQTVEKFVLDYMSSGDPQHPCAYQIPATSSGLTVLKKEVIDLAHTLGREVHFWVLNNGATIRKAIQLGVDGIITDRTDLAKEIVEEMTNHQLKPPKDGYNHNKFEYFVPNHEEEEIHTCVTWPCTLLQNSNWILPGILTMMLLLTPPVCIMPCFFNRRKYTKDKVIVQTTT